MVTMRSISASGCVLLLLWLCVGEVFTEVTWKSYITSLLHSTVPEAHENLVTVITQQLLMIHRATAHCLTQDGNSYRYPPVFDMTRSPCGVIHTVTPPVESITWNISVHNPFYINITLTRINLTDSVEGCRVESLQLVWGEGLRSERICGLRRSYTEHINSGRVIVIYATEGGWRKGTFSVIYQVAEVKLKSMPSVYMNLEEDERLITKFSDMFDGNYEDYYTDLSLTSLFSTAIEVGSRTVNVVFRGLPSFVLNLYILRSNATATDDVLNLQCYDGPFTSSPSLKLSTYSITNLDNVRVGKTVVERSRSFVMMCAFRMKYIGCKNCDSLVIRHLRYPSGQIRQVNIAESTNIILPENRYCYEKLCLLNLTSSRETSVKLRITHIELPNIDHSNDCLYEGVAVYESRKHDLYGINYLMDLEERSPDQLLPIARICDKVRQNIGGQMKEHYVLDTVVSTENSLIVAFYSSHQHTSLGSLHLIADISKCQGFYSFCGQVTRSMKDYVLHQPNNRYVEESYKSESSIKVYDLLRVTRYFLDINVMEVDHRAIPILERSAYIAIFTNVTSTYNIIALRPKACAVIQYIPHKKDGTWRALDCAISILRARDAGDGDFNIKLHQQIEETQQCANKSLLSTDKYWNYMIGQKYSKAYIVNPLIPQCGHISALATQLNRPSGDLLATQHSDLTTQYIRNTFVGIESMLHRFVNSLEHNILVSTSDVAEAGKEQYGISHIRALVSPDPHYWQPVPSFYQNLQSAITFWSNNCFVHLSVLLRYEFDHGITPYSKMVYHQWQFSAHLRLGETLTYTEPYCYYRRYIFLRVLPLNLHAATCKVSFAIDIHKPFGNLTYAEEITELDRVHELPLPASQLTHAYVAWGYKSLTWNDAHSKCRAVGGYLPSITSNEESEFLERVVWGKSHASQFAADHPCRVSTVVYSFYLGLNTSQVSIINYTLLYIFYMHLMNS